jgi:hypothetical protein
VTESLPNLTARDRDGPCAVAEVAEVTTARWPPAPMYRPPTLARVRAELNAGV